MELAQLRYFLEVARREHFTRAAEALYVSEPSVNRAIARLERELGAPLFDRRGRGVRLNALGRAFLARVERALNELEEGRREVRDLSDPERGVVSVGFAHTVGAELLPRLLRAFEDAHPLMRFQLTQTATRPQVLIQLDAGEVDLCISMPFPAHPHTRWVRLLTEEVYLAVPPHHPLARRETIALREVAAEPFISLKREYAMRLLADDLCRRAGFEPAIAFEGDEFATVRGLVSAGLGVALIPRLGWPTTDDSPPACASRSRSASASLASPGVRTAISPPPPCSSATSSSRTSPSTPQLTSQSLPEWCLGPGGGRCRIAVRPRVQADLSGRWWR